MKEELVVDFLLGTLSWLNRIERRIVRKSIVISGTVKAEIDVLRDTLENLARAIQIEIEDYENDE